MATDSATRDGTNKNSKDKKSGRMRIDLSKAAVTGILAACLAGLAWVFIMGVLIGRGYQPETAVPELAAIMPKAENATTPGGIAPAVAAKPAPEPEVLRPEDLDYHDNLSKTPTKTPAKAPAKVAAKVKPTPRPAAAKPAPKAKTKTKAERLPAPDDDQAVYDYRYQVAALRDPSSAKAFQSRLSKLGLVSSLEKADSASGTWHRIIVHFRGRPSDTRELKAKLATVGINKPIMRLKTPASD